MTQIPADWYPDPAPDRPPGRLRYWDGQQWTEHLHDPAPVPVAYPTQPPAYPGYEAYPPAQAPLTAQPVWAPEAARVAATPDGQPLSGWWRRVLAWFLDVLISIPVLLVGMIPVLVSQWDELSTWFDDLTYAIDHDTADPPDPALFDPSTGPGFALVVSLVVATVAYHVVFLRWKQATPGKLIMGMRVRRRETPGLPWSSIVLRVGFLGGLYFIDMIPISGFALIGFVLLLDVLWPLWDGKKQALHDKVAGTNVVLARRVPAQAPTAASPPPRW
jgi:uncharacterized RDD family membrane protein YckC